MGHAPPSKGKGKGIQFLRGLIGHRGGGCIAWPYAKDTRLGRGGLGYNGQVWKAHRLMCVLSHGKPPVDKPHVRHTCGGGHKGCVNPNHLEWSTVSQNQRDRRKHNTHHGATGSRIVKLTNSQVAEIRTHKLTQWAYADKFGCSLGCVQYWWRSSHDPALPGSSRTSIRRRNERLAQVR